MQHRRKILQGVVAANKMDKTLVVKVERTYRHPQYKKSIRRSQKYYVHAADRAYAIGERVRIAETRPLSKLKRWRVLKKVASVASGK